MNKKILNFTKDKTSFETIIQDKDLSYMMLTLNFVYSQVGFYDKNIIKEKLSIIYPDITDKSIINLIAIKKNMVTNEDLELENRKQKYRQNGGRIPYT